MVAMETRGGLRGLSLSPVLGFVEHIVFQLLDIYLFMSQVMCLMRETDNYSIAIHGLLTTLCPQTALAMIKGLLKAML